VNAKSKSNPNHCSQVADKVFAVSGVDGLATQRWGEMDREGAVANQRCDSSLTIRPTTTQCVLCVEQRQSSRDAPPCLECEATRAKNLAAASSGSQHNKGSHSHSGIPSSGGSQRIAPSSICGDGFWGVYWRYGRLVFPGYGLAPVYLWCAVRDLYLANDGETALRVAEMVAAEELWELTRNDCCSSSPTGLTATAGQRRK